MVNIKQQPGYQALRQAFKASPLNVLRHYLLAQSRNLRSPQDFGDLETYCLFIGHGRSGHSILGALLDAHPDAIVADEIDTLRYLAAGFNKSLIGQTLLAHSEKLAARQRIKNGRDGKRYSYWVPGQWQGRFRKLMVLGDTKAAKSARRLVKQPNLLTKLERTLQATVKVIHVLRNPYDNISTLAIKNYGSIAEATQHYFKDCQASEAIRKVIPPADLIVIRHEDLIQEPGATLTRLCNFLGLEPEAQYIEACTAILYSNPAKSRHKISWKSAEIQYVARRIAAFADLAGYSFDS